MRSINFLLTYLLTYYMFLKRRCHDSPCELVTTLLRLGASSCDSHVVVVPVALTSTYAKSLLFL